MKYYPLLQAYRIAVLIPCLNEANSIAGVIREFRKALPEATIYVFDNASTDATAELAHREGAIVRQVPYRGKGNVIRRMFADIDADIYIMADGDGTYDIPCAPDMVQTLVSDNLDMVVGTRSAGNDPRLYRLGHLLGNRVLTATVRHIFGGGFNDMLSGYRAFSRRYVKSFPAFSSGFEIETELTIHALELRMPTGEVRTRYGHRPSGSYSKLSTVSDGMRIFSTITRLYIVEHPLTFYFTVACLFILSGILLAVPLFSVYLSTGLVPRFPTALLCVGLVICGLLSIVTGLILDTVARSRHEIRHLAYLAIPGLKNRIEK